MKIKSKAPEGFLDSPFAMEQVDQLSRIDLSQRLTALYGKLDHGTVAVLNGRWGSGKSTFARKWLATLREEGFGTIYFDAFSKDYISDPFIALNSAILNKLNSLPNQGGERGAALKQNAIAVSKKLLIAGARVAVKAGTLGAINLSDLDISSELSGAASETAAGLAEAAVQELLDSQAKADAAFIAFRESLARIPGALSSNEGAGAGKAVFVIDELDRCRPDFALGLIESLKHFFESDSLHFVLVANKDFLISSVGAKYGLSIGSEEYLDKFFDFSIMFEEASAYRNSARNVLYAKRVISDLIPSQTNDSYEMQEVLSKIVGAFDLTFRQTEKIATNAALAYGAFGEREYRPTFLVAYLCFIKAIHPKIYQGIKMRRFAYRPFEEIILRGDWEETSYIERILTAFHFHSNERIDENDPKFEGYAGSSGRYNFASREDILPYLANSVVDRFSR